MPDGTFDGTLIERLRTLAARMGQRMSAFDLPVTDEAVYEFEARNGVELPVDYRWFVTHVASGGPGPANGLIPFAAARTDPGLREPWIDPVGWNETDGDYGDDRGRAVHLASLAIGP